jgi:hypothetical protein
MTLQREHLEFIEAAVKFCELIETQRTTPLRSLHAIRETLLALYAAALRLPATQEVSSIHLPVKFSVSEQINMRKLIEQTTAPDIFWFCYRPFATPFEKPIACSISDSLADIWFDLKPGLLALTQDQERWVSNVFWKWKFSFETHWGEHAVDSIWGIHKLLRDVPPETAY